MCAAVYSVGSLNSQSSVGQASIVEVTASTLQLIGKTQFFFPSAGLHICEYTYTHHTHFKVMLQIGTWHQALQPRVTLADQQRRMRVLLQSGQWQCRRARQSKGVCKFRAIRTSRWGALLMQWLGLGPQSSGQQEGFRHIPNGSLCAPALQVTSAYNMPTARKTSVCLFAGKTAIRTVVQISTIELVSGTEVILADSTRIVSKGHFQSDNATVRFGSVDSATGSAIQINDGGSVTWKGSRFVGNGTIIFGPGATVKEVSACSLDKSVEVSFNANKTKWNIWRNNNCEYPTIDLNAAGSNVRPYQCDKSGTG